MPHAKMRFEWDDVRVFLALLRKRTFRDAASCLDVNPSTIRRRIDILEAAVGMRLFERLPSGVTPTAAAEHLRPHMELLEHAALNVTAAAAAFEQQAEGLVKISAAPGIAEHFVAPAIPRLLERHPRLRVELESSIGYVDLRNREADLALRTRKPADGELIAQKLHVGADAVLGSPAYVRELGTLTHPAQARWITWGEDLSQLPSVRWVVDRVPASAIVLRTSCISGLLSAAESGVGLLLISNENRMFRQLVMAELSAELSASVSALPQLEFWMVSHRSLRDVPRVASVRRFLLEEVARMRQYGFAPTPRP